MLLRQLPDLIDLIKEHAVVWLIAAIGLSISVSAFLVIQEQFRTQSSAEFNWVAHNRSRLLKQGLENALEPVRLTRDYIQASSNRITRNQFHLAAEPLLNRNPGIEMIGLILFGQDKEYSQELGDKHTTGTGNSGRFILTHAEARTGSRFGLDFPIDSNPMLRQAIERAEASGDMTVSGRVALQQQSHNDYGVMASLPIYQSLHSSMSGLHQETAGFVVAILRLDKLTHHAISYLEPRGVDLLILDESATDEGSFLEYYASRLQPVGSFDEEDIGARFAVAASRVTEIALMADRKWSITAMPNARFLSAEAFSSGAWVILTGGALLTLLLSIYLLRTRLSIKERTMMNQLLKDREELFWQMTETVDDVFWAVSADGNHLLYISPTFETIWGVTCEAAYANPGLFVEAIHPKDRHLRTEGLEQARNGVRPIEIFYRVLHPDGTQRWIRDNLFPVRDASGAVSRLVGVAEDVSEKKQAEDALRDSESKLRTLFNQSPDTIMTVDGKGTILLMNHGMSLEPSVVRSLERDSAELLPVNYREDYRRLLALVFADGEVSYLPYQNEDGSWREIRIVPIVENDEIPAAMVISTDITEKRNLQAQAIHNARLASIGVMATGVAHDINNPNNAINSAATLFSHVWEDALPLFRTYYREQGDFSLGGLSFATEGEALGSLIAEIRDNSRRIEAIVSNLKQLGSSDHGELNERVDINSVLRAAVKMLGSNIDKYTGNFAVALAEKLPPVRGNLRQLEQVFLNVILNALQSLPDRSRAVRVESTIDSENCMVVVRVSDEGGGIAAEDVPRVTEPFFTTRMERGGTGLGLYISHTIISNHQGVMDIASSQGKGTVVTLRLPQMNSNRQQRK